MRERRHAHAGGGRGKTTFLALHWDQRRSIVNPVDEIGAIERVLPVAFARLAAGGVLGVISFHSLEDRPVKQFFRRMCGQPESADDSTPQDFRVRLAEPLTRKPITASAAEVALNPRSRSAKLRALRKF